jgi:PKD repeat protein
MLRATCRPATFFFLVLFLPAWIVLSQDRGPSVDFRGRPLYQQGVVVVKFKPVVPFHPKTGSAVLSGVASLASVHSRYGVTSIERMFRWSRMMTARDLPDLSRIQLVRFSAGVDSREVAEAFAADPNVEYAEPVPCYYPDDIPNDSLYADLHHLPRIMAEQAWDVHKGEAGDSAIIVAIVDSGTEWFHPDLAPNIWQNRGEDADGDGHTLEPSGSSWVMDPGDLNGVDDDGNGYTDDLIGWDVWNDDNNPNTGDSHGTHVSGIAGGATNNGFGIASISHNVTIMPISSWNGSVLPNPYEGIAYAAENGAHIINNSWGSEVYSRAGEEAVAYAHGLGSIVVAAAGNENHALPHYPPSYPHVISVASTDVEDRKASYSSYGIGVDISAPGGSLSNIADRGILSTGSGGSYLRMQGTSMASPLVAGLLGLIKSYRPGWDNDKVVRQLLGTADDISSLNTLPLGGGRINALSALTDTTAAAPQGFRLEFAPGLRYFNIPYVRTISPGDTAGFQFTIRNYAHQVASDNATFTLTTTDTSLQLLNPVAGDSIAADGYSMVEHVFQVAVAPGTIPHAATLTLNIAADKPVTYGSSLDIEVFVAGAGVFVWEALPDTRDFSGRFIADLFTAKGIPVVYSNSFPTTLEGFSAVFLSYGNYGSYLRAFDDSMAVLVQRYLQAGGNVYLEGSGSLTADQRFNGTLQALFGVSSVTSGSPSKSPITSLSGQAGALTVGIVFDSSNQVSYSYNGLFTPGGGGIAAFVEPGYGTVAVQCAGSFGQRTFCSSYPLGELVDRDTLSNRYGLFIKIGQFFGLPIDSDYLVADFASAAPTGHAPLTVPFSDRTASNTPVTSWEWDFENDGAFDATAQNPDHTFLSPGIYSVKLRSGNGTTSSERSRTAYVHVFDGNSSLLFDRLESYVDVPATASLNVMNDLTVEAWIHPLGWGEAGSGFGRIIDKGALLLFLESGGMLVMSIDHSNLTESRTNTLPGSISLHAWQHVAVTYSGASSDLRMYINGNRQTLNEPDPISGPVMTHSSSKLVIGNNGARSRTFDGRIDDVRVWNTVRTEAELQSAMNDTLSGDEPGLVAYWRFDEGTGDQVSDRSPNGNNGTAAYTAWRQGRVSPVTSIAERGPGAPVRFELQQNYPNPFNPITDIEYRIAEPGRVTLEVFDVLGRGVAMLVDETKAPGIYHATFDSAGFASGVYIYRMQAGSLSLTRKMMLLR